MDTVVKRVEVVAGKEGWALNCEKVPHSGYFIHRLTPLPHPGMNHGPCNGGFEFLNRGVQAGYVAKYIGLEGLRGDLRVKGLCLVVEPPLQGRSPYVFNGQFPSRRY